MSRADLLRMIADARYTLPDAVDGLAEPNVPTLYFHDRPLDDLQPWLHHLDASWPEERCFPGFGGTADFKRTLWHGKHLNMRVDVALYQDDAS